MAELKLLIPLDGSTQAERALAYIPLLTPLGSLSLRLVGAVDIEPLGPQAEEQAARATHLLQTYLTKCVERLRAPGVGVESTVLVGSAAEVILEQAGEWNPDLIIITTHGRSGVQRWRLGSVADKVVRGATVNTLLIGPHAGTDAAPTINSILVPLDGSQLAENALNVGKGLAKSLGAKLHLMQVVTLPIETSDGYGFSYYPALLESVEQAAQEYMASLKESVPAAAATAVLGAPATALLDYVEKEHIDLVVMTSHGRGGFFRAALGSVTDRMLGGPAPVLIVRPAH